jgi:WD40 repeat protein
VESEWKLWDAATGELQRTVTAPGRLLALALSPDGNWLACGLSKDVWLYDLRTDAPGRVVADHAALVTSVAFLPDSSALLTSSHDLTVQRIGLSDGKLQWRLPGHHEQVNSVALSADGGLLVTGSSDGRFARRLIKAADPATGSGAVLVWDARTGRLKSRLSDPTEQVMAVAVSPDSKQVVGGGANRAGAGVVHAWDAASGNAVWSTADHASEVLAVAYSPDGTRLVSGSADGVVQLHDARTGAVLHTMSGHAGEATSLAFAKDGALVVCGEGLGGIRVWDARSGKLIKSNGPTEGSRAAAITMDRMFNTVAMLPDGSRWYSRNASVGNTYSERLRLWEIGADEQPRELKTPPMGARPIALSPDGSILAGGGKSVQLWDAKSGKELRNLSGILKKVQAIAFSPDGRLLVSGGSYGTTNIWEVASGRHLLTLFAFDDGQTGKTNDEWLAYSPDGSYDGSPGAERHLAWRVDDELKTAATIGQDLHQPERIEALLKLGSPQSSVSKSGE